MDNFNTLNAPQENTVVDNNDPKKAAKEAKVKEMTNLLKETVATDPTYVTRVRSLSDKVQVINTLGYADGGNIKVDESAKETEDGKRKLVTTSQIVGYRVQNVGEMPIKYVTEEFAKDEAGVFVGTKVEKVMAPGETVDFTRKYMTIFCSQTEVSFQLKNGKIVRGSGAVKQGDVDAELEAHYFSFNDKNIKVNDDTVKLNIANKKKVGDQQKWIIKPEFEKAFGYLNNAKPASKRGRGPATGTKLTTQDAAANYIQKLLQDKGI